MSRRAHLMMVGARNAGSLRGDDYFDTPTEAVDALCAAEPFDGSIWEPACGAGAISNALSRHGHTVVSTDLVNRRFGEHGVDFLMEYQPRAPNIVTNPPYKLDEEFAEHACRLASHKVALLMRLVWLAGQRRRRMFEKTNLSRVLIFSKRIPRMHRPEFNGEKATSTIDFAWFVWDKSYSGPTTLKWLP